MFANLYIEMKRKKLTQVKLAEALGITNRALCKKMGGGDFTSDEMFTIQQKFFPEKSLEYLFRRDPENV